MLAQMCIPFRPNAVGRPLVERAAVLQFTLGRKTHEDGSTLRARSVGGRGSGNPPTILAKCRRQRFNEVDCESIAIAFPTNTPEVRDPSSRMLVPTLTPADVPPPVVHLLLQCDWTCYGLVAQQYDGVERATERQLVVLI